MLATRWQAPFSDPNWLFEAKWDGVRAICEWEGSLRLFSRAGNDITTGYPELAGLSFDRPTVLDGELIAMDEFGKPSFGRLQHRMHRRGRSAAELVESIPVSYVVFDLLQSGEPLIDKPIEERLDRLAALELPGPAVVSQTIPEAGDDLYMAVVEEGLEGIVAKRRGSSYRPGSRSPDWRKVSVRLSARVVVGGYVAGSGSRDRSFASLIGGVWVGKQLRYVGAIGTGFDQASLGAIKKALDEMETSDSPFEEEATLPPGSSFVFPSLVAMVEYKELTDLGHLRAPSFKGFTDEPVEGVTWESEFG